MIDEAREEELRGQINSTFADVMYFAWVWHNKWDEAARNGTRPLKEDEQRAIDKARAAWNYGVDVRREYHELTGDPSMKPEQYARPFPFEVGVKEQDAVKAENSFLNLPSTPAAINLLNLFGIGSDLRENPKQVIKREKALDTHKKIKIEGDSTRPEILRVTIESRSALQVYELEYKYLEGSNAGLKKVYSFISSKISSIFHDGAPVKNSIEFPLQELVDSGMYKTLDTARRGFLDAGEALIRVGVKGWLRLCNKKRYEQVDVGPFFTLFRIKKGICIVKINPDFAWGMFTAFYTPLPPYAYKLPINAFTLISLIFTVARQRWEKIGKTGALKFPIKMKHIQTRLNLPDEDKTLHPRRDIRDVVEKSIEDIEATSNTKDFTITPYRASGEPTDDDDSISTFLAGYLEIELKGEYAESFTTIANKAEKRVKAAQKKKEKALSQKVDNKQ